MTKRARPQRNGSWIIRNKATKEAIAETWLPQVVAAINTAKYEAVPILNYLYELNATIKTA